MGGLDQMLQISQAAPVRRDVIKIARGVPVKLTVSVEYDRRNPDGCCTECLNVIQLLFKPFEVTAVDRATVAGIVVAFGIIV